jgi:tetratricopeptide (TPR) repeat protein
VTKATLAPGATVDSVEFDALVRRSIALHEQGYFEAARQVALEVVARQKDHAGALIALANTLRDLGRFDEALRVLGHVLRSSPNDTNALSAAALTFFFKEDWQRAWRSFDVRFRLMEQPPAVTTRGPDGKPVPKPRWREGPVPPSLLVLGEQGLGDTIMFARYLPLLRKAGARVVCVAQQRLLALLKTLDADIEWRPSEQAGSVSGIKAWTPMMQLPQALGLTPDQFIQTIPYLRAESARVAHWKQRIGSHGFKVGVAWQGNPDKRIDVGRSAPLSAFAPLAEIPGVRLISLQTHNGLNQIADVPFADRIEKLGEEFDNGPDGFLDTAAAMEHLDLVITVDTSLGHLAGALGRPAIILLKAVGADWRWLYQRDDTVWYPTLRLFRQSTPGDWNELLLRVARDLRARAAKAAGITPVTPVSVGELLDKISILAIKRERITDPAKRANVEKEYQALIETSDKLALPGAVKPLLDEIKAVNETLWDIEDDIRGCEAKSDFGPRFIELARSVYKQNDKRAALKAEINRLCNSSLREEKHHKPY